MYKKTLSKDYTDTAITLSRLYGIAETLYPWEYLDNDRFTDIIKVWTEEFLCADKIIRTPQSPYHACMELQKPSTLGNTLTMTDLQI